MREAVLDASVILKWFGTHEETGTQRALGLRLEFATGRLGVTVPHLLALEILNVAGRRWHLPANELVDLASALDRLEFDVREPDLSTVAAWVGRGLTAYDAAYVALAQTAQIAFITDDQEILQIAPGVAIPLGEY